MSLVYVINKTEGKQPISDYLLLEEALNQWKIMGYNHTEYQITMCEGPEILIEDDPIEVMHFFFSDEDLQDDLKEFLDGFSFNTFLLGGDHESGS